jgi:hypothetical protein
MLPSRIVLLACAWIPVGALAAPTEVHALRQEVAALQLDHTLNLTQQQAQALLPLIQDAKAKVQASRTQRASAQPALVAALTQAVADLKANGDVSAATLESVRAARGGSPGTLRQDVASFWQQARQVLTADQLRALRSAKLGIHPTQPNASARSTQGDRGRHFARRFGASRILLSDAFVSLVQARAG